MTHNNSCCQPHQDVGFAGMSMSSVSLEPQATETAQWPCGCAECSVCARMCSYKCVVLWLCASSLWRMNVCACAFIAVCICPWLQLCICICSTKSISKSNVFSDDLFTLPFTEKQCWAAAGGQLWVTSDMCHRWGCINLYNMLLIGLRLSLSVTTHVFCMQQAQWLLWMTFACSRPVFLRAVFCTPITRKKGTWNMRT